MKKSLPLIIPILLIILLAACTPQIVRDGGLVVRGSNESVAVEADDLSDAGDTDTDVPISRGGEASSDSHDSAYDKQDIVYATKTGKKYHKDGCGHLSKSKVPITLEQAEQQGLTPCSVCYPAT